MLADATPGSLHRGMSTTAPRRTAPWILQGPGTGQVHAPAWFERLPRWASTGGVLVVLLVVSTFIRTRYLSGQLWGDEALAIGIASHPLSTIFGALRHAGASPLYFLILHAWISAWGSSESATHMFSLLCGLIAIPAAMWAGWSTFGRRAGFYAAALFAFSGFLTQYAQETQVFELAGLLALIATASFLHAFVLRRRGHVVLFAAALVLLAYTSFWAFFFWVGLAVALIPVARASDDRAGVLRDAGLAFAAAFVLYLPWLPTLAFQIGHDTAPYTFYTFTGPTFPAALFGGDRVLASFVVVAAAALLPLLSAERRRSREAVTLWALLAVVLVTMLCAAPRRGVRSDVGDALPDPDRRPDPAHLGLRQRPHGDPRPLRGPRLDRLRGQRGLLLSQGQERHARRGRGAGAAPGHR